MIRTLILCVSVTTVTYRCTRRHCVLIYTRSLLMFRDEVMEGCRPSPTSDVWNVSRRIVELQPYTFPPRDISSHPRWLPPPQKKHHQNPPLEKPSSTDSKTTSPEQIQERTHPMIRIRVKRLILLILPSFHGTTNPTTTVSVKRIIQDNIPGQWLNHKSVWSPRIVHSKFWVVLNEHKTKGIKDKLLGTTWGQHDLFHLFYFILNNR